MENELRTQIEDAVRAHAGTLAATARGPLVEALLTLAERAVLDERRRVVSVCVQRGELWRATSERANSFAIAEARARSNEAFYLADLLETGQQLPDVEPSGGGSGGGVIEARGHSRS